MASQQPSRVVVGEDGQGAVVHPIKDFWSDPHEFAVFSPEESSSYGSREHLAHPVLYTSPAQWSVLSICWSQVEAGKMSWASERILNTHIVVFGFARESDLLLLERQSMLGEFLRGLV
jgi:hypothetical protein